MIALIAIAPSLASAAGVHRRAVLQFHLKQTTGTLPMVELLEQSRICHTVLLNSHITRRAEDVKAHPYTITKRSETSVLRRGSQRLEEMWKRILFTWINLNVSPTKDIICSMFMEWWFFMFSLWMCYQNDSEDGKEML